MFEPKVRKTRSDKKIDGRVEAHLVALVCQGPPEGESRWKLQLLAERLVELEVVEHISSTMVGRLLKKRTWTLTMLIFGSNFPAKELGNSCPAKCGFCGQKNFHKYHRVLSLVEWRALEAARILLKLLLACFLPVGPVIIGIDETLERHWGQKIAHRGIYRV